MLKTLLFIKVLFIIENTARIARKMPANLLMRFGCAEGMRSFFPVFVNLDAWAILIFLACLCILPALVVRAQTRNSQSEHSPHRRSHLSPQAWIIILPVWFFTVCMELAYLFEPDYNSFAEVFVTWLITGLAGLIIALAVKLCSKEQVVLSRHQAF